MMNIPFNPYLLHRFTAGRNYRRDYRKRAAFASKPAARSAGIPGVGSPTLKTPFQVAIANSIPCFVVPAITDRIQNKKFFYWKTRMVFRDRTHGVFRE
jgi:hypothetical protein